MKNEIEELSKRMAATEEKIKEMRKLLDVIA